jgi:hypothetical protein
VKCKGKTFEGDDTTLINNCILDISNKTITINVTDTNETIFGFFTIKEFKCIEEGIIPVELVKAKSKNTFTATLERFNKEDDIEIEEVNGIINFKRFKPRRLSYKINTITEDECTCYLDMDLPHTYNEKQDIWVTGGGKKYITKIQVNSKELKEVIKDGDRIAHRSYPIMVNQNEVLITVFNRKTGEGSEREIDVKEKKVGTKPVGSLFSSGFGNVFGNFSGVINIWLYQDQPLIIGHSKDQYECVIILSSDETAESEENMEEEVNNSIIDDVKIELDEEDLEEISEEDLYVDYDENESVVENWVDEDEDEEDGMNYPSEKWPIKDLKQYLRNRDIKYKSNETKESLLEKCDKYLNQPVIDDVEKPKEKPSKRWGVKRLIEYAVLNHINIDYGAEKKVIYETIMKTFEDEE